MTIYDLKPAFQNLLRPLVLLLKNMGFTPNIITVLTCVLSMGMGILLYFNSSNKIILLSIPFFMFIRMALNAIDGLMAKEHNMKSDLGALLNEFTDVLADSFLFMGFVSNNLISAPLLVAITLLAAMSELVGISALSIGSSRRYDGPMGKSDRAFVFGLISLLLAFQMERMLFYSGILSLTLLLLVFTIINRMRKALAEKRAL